MPKKIEKRAFVFYASYLDVIEEFPEERRGKIAMALIEYGLDDCTADDSLAILALNPEERIVLSPIIEAVDVQKRRYVNKQMINGAINLVREKMIETIDLTSDSNNTVLEKYQYIIETLEQKLDGVTRHNLDIFPQEIAQMLPKGLHEKFYARFAIKTWEEQFRRMIDEHVRNNPKSYGWVTSDTKELVYKDVVNDFLKNGKLTSETSVYFDKYKNSTWKGTGL